MSSDDETGGAPLPISAVERDTGLSKDTLRVWERRYGFPTPVRSAQAERSYPPQQVHKLRLLKRLVDSGHRPGQVVPLTLEALQQLSSAAEGAPPAGGPDENALGEWFAQVRRHDVHALRRSFAQALLQKGLERFVTEVVAPMNRAVGEAWMRGQIQVFEEHLYTECVQTTLRQALGTLPGGRGDGPRVLLATVPQEPHGLGLLMAEALFSLQGCDCLSLGVRTPVPEIVQAARAHRADIVGLSFTDSVNAAQVQSALRELREQLPTGVELWAGGRSAALHRRATAGVLVVADLAQLGVHLARWRQAREGGESP